MDNKIQLSEQIFAINYVGFSTAQHLYFGSFAKYWLLLLGYLPIYLIHMYSISNVDEVTWAEEYWHQHCCWLVSKNYKENQINHRVQLGDNNIIETFIS